MIGDTSGTSLVITTRVRDLLMRHPAMPPAERAGWYRELAHMLLVAAEKWEACLAEEAARADR